jgi:hypothetical protein
MFEDASVHRACRDALSLLHSGYCLYALLEAELSLAADRLLGLPNTALTLSLSTIRQRLPEFALRMHLRNTGVQRGTNNCLSCPCTSNIRSIAIGQLSATKARRVSFSQQWHSEVAITSV